MNCSVCNSNKKIVHHHLSYEPEIVVNVCHKCHIVMHNSVGLNEKQLNVINSWVKQYGDQWKDGSEKYYRSEQYKKTRKEYEQTDKGKKYRKESQIEYRFKRLSPEKMLKRIEDMERKIELVEKKKYELDKTR